MIQFIRSWVINIIIIIVFISFLEIILPNGNMKKYIKVLTGLLIIMVLINPFINLITKDINIEREVLTNIGKSYSYYEEENENYISMQTQQITNIYREQLYKEINEIITKDGTYAVSNMHIKIIEDNTKENYGEIIGIEVGLENIDRENTENKYTIKIDEIQNVSISTIADGLTSDLQITEKCKEIQKDIAVNYQIPEENVKVYLKTSRR